MNSTFLLLLFLSLINLLFVSVSCASFSEFVYPNFTASNLRFIDSSKGAFLFSHNSIFKAGLFSPGDDDSSSAFYFSVVHVDSGSTIWSSNRDSPVSSSGKMNLTPQGISVVEDGKSQIPVWSTPVLASPVNSLRLTDSGNLLLLDRLNVSLWESFDLPTDSIVLGQRLRVGMFLSGSVSPSNLSSGDYKFLVGESDGLMQWRGQNYWKLRMHTRANVDSNFPVEYLTVTTSGLALMGRNGTVVVLRVALPPSSDFRVAKMDSSGKFIVSRFSGKSLVTEFSGPMVTCQIPFVCGQLGLCNLDNASENQSCSCPDEMRLDASKKVCVPVSQSLSLPVSCEASKISYLELGLGVSYFSTHFSDPVDHGLPLSACHDLCSKNCSCLGVFYESTSRSCYLVKDSFGSLSLVKDSPDNHDLIGYVKLSIKKPNGQPRGNKNRGSNFPVIALVLLPCSGFFLLIALGFLCWRRCAVMRYSSIREKQVTRLGSFGSGDLGSFHIPGLPQKFEFEELEQATENFKMQIGSGGFGAVYKGTLPDETLVAVKKITNHGLHGRQEFCTEIAIIGNIRHTNLVKLRGFCARGRQLLLVYEYMNHGSLEKTLFSGNGPVLEWQERFDIALGTARGLAYLHSGCDQKIIHCDVKPENILLHDHFQPKLSDFGLSKLLSQEESSLFTTMRGTRGYLAPEWITNAAISEKADVYSYGMVLLELVSGRKNCSFRSRSNSGTDENNMNSSSTTTTSTGMVYFPLYALDMHEQGRYMELADPRLEGRVTSQEAEKLVRIALCCVHEEPALRPTMAAVVGMFEGSIPLGIPRMESLNFLRFYGLRFAESSMVEGQNGESESMVFHRRESSNSGGSRHSASYVASQEVSGPR
ncbi:PREDICTED: G-type lectin S-receptor-like serine/threonine-protein kinase At5g35370 [Camelina sativa]|uniref:Receptor-like serine/threonine-protein kinase n=1 Tax=Camelina sativa TaxID=90675 RepID=A0ABM0UG93_CAMSA|nr:PREDICTED: G-type lectin S-receptor-like serine/threonine-protein kinase At5g35370 [Camelina sativa]